MNQEAAKDRGGRRFAMNPVLSREIKERMRSPRATVILVVYLALLAGVLYLTYRLGLLTLQSQMFGGGFIGSSTGASALGRAMFEVLAILLLGLVAFIAPGASTGSIAGERERGTLQLLQVTLLKPQSIVLGKLAASLGYVLLLLVASLPLFTVALILGGVTPGQAARGLLVITALAIFLATVGTYLSSIARRTLHATIGTYAITFVLLFGTILTYGAERIARSSGFPQLAGRPVSTYLNPFAALADAVVDPRGNSFIPSPLSIAAQMTTSFIPGVGVGGMSEPPVIVSTGGEGANAWQLTARSDPMTGLCVGVQDNRGGSESCGDGPAGELLNVHHTQPFDGSPPIIYGPVTTDARKVRVELAEGDPVEVKPLTEEAEDAGFEDISFYVAELAAGQEPVNVIALGKGDKELASQPVVGIPPIKAQGGVVAEDMVGGGGIPTMVPPEPAPAAPPPDAAAPPAPVPDAALIAPDVPVPLPAPRPGAVMIDPMPVEPGFDRVGNDSLSVWVVHSLLLLVSSVLLVVAGSYQLRRPRSGARFGRRARA